MFSEIYGLSNSTFKDFQDEGPHKLEKYIGDSFEHFKTMVPNRVTASQAICHAKYSLLFRDNIAIESKEIIDYLESYQQKAFIVKIQKKQKDGYIQKHK